MEDKYSLFFILLIFFINPVFSEGNEQEKIIKKIAIQLQEYKAFHKKEHTRSPDAKFHDLLTGAPTSPPPKITKFETVDVPFMNLSCENPFFLDGDRLACPISSNIEPIDKYKDGYYYLLNLEINLKTGLVTPHPEYSTSFPGGPYFGEIRCYDPLTNFMAIMLNPHSKNVDNMIMAQGYWNGHLTVLKKYKKNENGLYKTKYLGRVNPYTCKFTSDEAQSELAPGIYGSALRPGDGFLFKYGKTAKETLNISINQKFDKDKNTYTVNPSRVEPFNLTRHYYQYIPFMNSYLLNGQVSDCRNADNHDLIFYGKDKGVWRWPVPEEILRNCEHGKGHYQAIPVKNGIVWFDSVDNKYVKGIYYQSWDKPSERIHLSDGNSLPLLNSSSPDGCRVIYLVSFEEYDASFQFEPNYSLAQYRMTNFCKEIKHN
jgi:hypothetical protein